MIKKIVLILLIIFVLYIVAIFVKPDIATGVSTLIGAEKFQENITKIKTTLDGSSVTDIDTVYSGALDIKNKVVDGVEQTKNKIDDIRETAGEIEETYGKAKDIINTTSEKLEEAQEFLNDVNELSNSIKNIVNTGAVQ